MNLHYFPTFLRSIFPDLVKESDGYLIQIGDDFKRFIVDKFKGTDNQLKEILNIDPWYVTLKIGEPFRLKGYHPGLLRFLCDFLNRNQIVTKTGQELNIKTLAYNILH